MMTVVSLLYLLVGEAQKMVQSKVERWPIGYMK